jgi:hypothetical protein
LRESKFDGASIVLSAQLRIFHDAQAVLDRPIKIVVPLPAGGSPAQQAEISGAPAPSP